MVSLADSVTGDLNCSTVEVGVQTVVYGQSARRVGPSQNMRLRFSCFSLAVSKAGLQDYAVLRRVGMMCSHKTDLARRWSVQYSAPPPTSPPPPPPPDPLHRSGGSDVIGVSAATDGTVNQMPLFRSGVHPCCLVLICLKEQCVADGEVVLSTETQQHEAVSV